MTTTLVPGTLTVTISEALTINDGNEQDHGVAVTNIVTTASVAGVVRRLVTAPTSEVGLMSFGSDLATTPGTPQSTYLAGHFAVGTLRNMRITNMDDANHIVLVLRGSSGSEFAALLDAGQSFLLPVDNSGGVASTVDAAASALTVSLETLLDVTVKADTGACDLEVFAANV